MSQLLITFADNAKIAAFLAFVQDLKYVQKAELLPEVAPALPAPPAHGDYGVEDIKAIASRFPKKHKWTAPDLQKHFPQDLKVSLQIIQNQLFIMPSPNNFHQAISEELGFQIGAFVRQNKIGKLRYAPIDVKFDNNNVVQPDIIFVALTRYDIMQEGGIVGAPDLVIEIWSPANKKKERNMKHDLYETQGVTEYWQIYPDKKRITVEVLNEEGKYEKIGDIKNKGTVDSQVLKGFSVDIEALWESCQA